MKTYKFKQEHIEKLFKDGRISKQTAEAHGYAEGGAVVSPDAESLGQAASDVAPEEYQGPKWMQSLRSSAGLAPGENAVTKGLSSLKGGIQSLSDQHIGRNVPPDIAAKMSGIPMEESVGSTGANMTASMSEQGGPSGLAGNGPRVEEQLIPDMPSPSMQQGFDAGQAIAGGQIGFSTKMANEAAMIQKQAMEDQSAADKVLEQGQKFAQEALAANPNPDQIREKFWDDKTTSQKVMAGIGLIMGAFSSDGVNRSVQLIDKQIDQNIKAQELKAERLGKLSDQSNTLYSQMRQKGLDRMQTSIAMKDLMYKDVSMQLQKQQAASSSVESKAKLMEAQAKLQELQVKNRQTYIQQVAGARLTAGTTPSGQKLTSAQTAQLVAALPPERRALYIPGANAFANDAGDASKIKAADVGILKSQDILNKLMNMDRSLPFARRTALAGTYTTMLRAAMREPVLGPGTMQEKEYERLVEMIPDVSDLNQVNAKARLQGLSKILGQSQQSMYQAYGLTPMGASGGSSLPAPGARSK